MKPSSPVSHDNGFGVMRLAFAILVLARMRPSWQTATATARS